MNHVSIASVRMDPFAEHIRDMWPMRGMIEALLNRVSPARRSFVSAAQAQVDAENSTSNRTLFAPPGHFHSPIPSITEIRKDEQRIFEFKSEIIPGVDLNKEYQLRLLDQLEVFYSELPYTQDREIYSELMALREWYERAKDETEKKAIQEKGERLLGKRPRSRRRYFFENPNYGYADGVFLYCMLRHLRPKRIIEVGSGYSSCIMLDTNELHSDGSVECTFIDPHPQMLRALLRKDDHEHIRVIEKRIQDVNVDEFRTLGRRDILFIDSSHVSKVGSDVNYVLFEVLPNLSADVFIHFHDIFFPFEYPKEWVYAGRAWNESYLLRAFLQYNAHFEIVLFTTYLTGFHGARLERTMPLCMIDKGSSIWLRRR
ncbi:MAG: class I SAM-dependent methyltransferase [Deltaproteobacteria bacterium]|nr:class I SAM-dependent methyltransferase [Deltaproteobacteria bacterium]